MRLKNTNMSFRTSEQYRNDLRKLSKKERRPIVTLIEIAIEKTWGIKPNNKND